MTPRSHLLLDGQAWETCTLGDSCSLKFHVELDPAEAQLLPKVTMYKLFDAFDPPTEADDPFTATFTSKVWFDGEGELHRDYDLPAKVTADGTRHWYQHGRRHRVDGPAVVGPDGSEIWYRNDERHRDGDLPAATNAVGDQWWYKDDRIHREFGPATIRVDGSVDYYWRGEHSKPDEQGRTIPMKQSRVGARPW